MISVATNSRIFVFAQPTDMRKSFNGLSGLVAAHFDVELLSGHLFLFFNRRRDCIKILACDRDETHQRPLEQYCSARDSF